MAFLISGHQRVRLILSRGVMMAFLISGHQRVRLGVRPRVSRRRCVPQHGRLIRLRLQLGIRRQRKREMRRYQRMCLQSVPQIGHLHKRARWESLSGIRAPYLSIDLLMD